MKFTQRQAERLVAEWQKILRVQDWTVFVKVKRTRDMDAENAFGSTHIQRSKRMAAIEILDPDDDVELIFSEDREVTTVHELIHLIFSPFMSQDENSPEWMAQEQAIDQLARAFVALKRKS